MLIWYSFRMIILILMWFSIQRKYNFEMAQTKRTCAFFVFFARAQPLRFIKEMDELSTQTTNSLNDTITLRPGYNPNARITVADWHSWECVCVVFIVCKWHWCKPKSCSKSFILKFSKKWFVVNSVIQWAIYLTGVKWRAHKNQSFWKPNTFSCIWQINWKPLSMIAILKKLLAL